MNPNRKPAPEGLEKEFEYLDWLRMSGITNMWGAAPYLARAFNMNDEEAGTILLKWMDAFK